MRLIQRKGKKLFYKKYLYKIVFDFAIGHIFRAYHQKTDQLDYVTLKLAEYRKMLKGKKYLEHGYYRKVRFGIKEVKEAELLRAALLSTKDFMVRQDYNDRMTVYINDRSTLMTVLNKLETVDWVEIWEPDSTSINCTDTDILVSGYADKYAFKVKLDVGKIRRENAGILNWIKANRDKIKITDYALHSAYSFIGVYVRDEKVLMLLQMSDRNYIKQIERLVLPS